MEYDRFGVFERIGALVQSTDTEFAAGGLTLSDVQPLEQLRQSPVEDGGGGRPGQ